MDDLIEALQIFRLYSNEMYPTNCSHDILQVNVDPAVVSPEHLKRLEELSFGPSDEYGFESCRFGSA